MSQSPVSHKPKHSFYTPKGTIESRT